MSDVYYLNHSGPEYPNKTALIDDARAYLRNTGKTPTYSINQSEANCHFTAEELGEPVGDPSPVSLPAADPRPFKFGEVVTLRSIEAPKMIVMREIEEKFNGTAFEDTVGVLWFNGDQEEQRAFKAELLRHAD